MNSSNSILLIRCISFSTIPTSLALNALSMFIASTKAFFNTSFNTFISAINSSCMSLYVNSVPTEFFILLLTSTLLDLERISSNLSDSEFVVLLSLKQSFNKSFTASIASTSEPDFANPLNNFVKIPIVF